MVLTIKIPPLILLWTLTMSSAYQISYSDCQHPTKVRRLDRKSLCAKSPTVNFAADTYDLLQTREVTLLNGFSCQVRKWSMKLYCGAFSHMKLIGIPKSNVPINISPEACRKMVLDLEFVSPAGRKYPVKLDTNNLLHGMELGEVTLTGKSGALECLGQQTKIGGKVLDGVLEVDQWSVELLTEKFEVTPTKFIALHSHKELTCTAAQNGCRSGTHSFFWNQARHLCSLERVKTVKVSQEQGFLVDHKAKLMFKASSTLLPVPPNCPSGAQIKATQHTRLFLGTVSPSWPALLGAEVDLDLEMRMMAEYMSFQSTSALATSLGALDQLLCDRTKHIITSNDVFRMHNTTFAKVKGDVLYLFECKEVLGSLVSSEHCIVDLKLNKEGYVDPNTRMWKATTSPRSCQEHFPTAFETQTGIWVTAEPQLKAAAAPDYRPLLEVRKGVLSPELFDRATNLYTQEEIRAWKQSLLEAGYAKDISSTISHGLCMGDTSCQSDHRYTESTQYSLSNLVPKVLEAMTPWTRFTKWIDDSAAYICLAMLLIEGFKILTYSISFMQNVYRQGVIQAIFCCWAVCFPAWAARPSPPGRDVPPGPLGPPGSPGLLEAPRVANYASPSAPSYEMRSINPGYVRAQTEPVRASVADPLIPQYMRN